MLAFLRDRSGWHKVYLSKGKERSYNCKISEVTALRGSSGAYLPVTKFWLEQTAKRKARAFWDRNLKVWTYHPREVTRVVRNCASVC